MLLEGSNWNGWMDRQREVVPKRWGTRVKSSCACVGLDPSDQQTNSFAWSQWMEWKWCCKHGVKKNRQFFMQNFVGQRTDLEYYSGFYWQPIKGMKQWNTVSKWKWLWHNVGQSILNTLKFGEVSGPLLTSPALNHFHSSGYVVTSSRKQAVSGYKRQYFYQCLHIARETTKGNILEGEITKNFKWHPQIFSAASLNIPR